MEVTIIASIIATTGAIIAAIIMTFNQKKEEKNKLYICHSKTFFLQISLTGIAFSGGGSILRKDGSILPEFTHS